SGTACRERDSHCSTCEPRTATGTPCLNSNDCQSGYCIDQGDGGRICGAPPPTRNPGESCNAGESCSGYTSCSGAGDGGRVCQPLVGVGARCDVSASACYYDLTCAAVTDGGTVGTCAVFTNNNGAPCSRSDQGYTCTSYTCLFSSPSAQ